MLTPYCLLVPNIKVIWEVLGIMLNELLLWHSNVLWMHLEPSQMTCYLWLEEGKVGRVDSALATSPMSNSQQTFCTDFSKISYEHRTRTELCRDNMCKRADGQRCWYCSHNREGVSTDKTSKNWIAIKSWKWFFNSILGKKCLKYRRNKLNRFETSIILSNSNSWITLWLKWQ